MKAKPYKKGDIVFVGDLPDNMSHFSYENEHVVIINSYHDQYGGGRRDRLIYTVMGDDGNQSSWYPHDILSPIERISGLTKAEWERQQVDKLRLLNDE